MRDCAVRDTKECSVSGCCNKDSCRGLCDKHYKEAMAKENPCRVNGCNRWAKYSKTSLCEKHQYRYKKFGTTARPKYNRDLICEKVNCVSTVATMGLCKKHYAQQQGKMRKAEYKKEGRCIACGSAHPEGQLCKKCKERAKRSRQKRKAKLIEAGICCQCGKSKATVTYGVQYGNKKKSVAPVCNKCYLRRTAYHVFKSEKLYYILEDLWEEQKGICYYSGIAMILGENSSIDHIIPRSAGGKDIKENLCWCLWPINQIKSGLSIDRFVTLCQQIVKNDLVGKNE